MGVNRLGFSYRTVGQQYLGYWMDLFEVFKRQYNFEKKRALYRMFSSEEVSTLDAI